jgi:Bacterial archaeo-eukaryotic release factor family 3
MDLLRRSDLHQLLEIPATPCVSLFTPTFRAGKETQQNPVRVRKSLDEARSRLTAMGMRDADACALLKPGRDLLADTGFWHEQGDGLALFLAPGVSRVLRLSVALPDMLVVSERFHVRPLLTAMWPDQSYYVLALSQREVRLLLCSRFGVERVGLDGIPNGIEAIKRLVDAERPRQARVAPPRGATGGTVHGHAEGREWDDLRVAEYLRQVAHGVGKLLNTESDIVLVVAAVDRVQALYREAAGFPPVLEQGIVGSPDRLSDEELRARGWAIVEPLARARMDEDAARYVQAAGRGTAPTGLAGVLRAAMEGRVEALFASTDDVRWGRFDLQTGRAEQHDRSHPGDEDLMDRAVALTIAGNGVVYSVGRDEMPASEPLAAVTRF